MAPFYPAPRQNSPAGLRDCFGDSFSEAVPALLKLEVGLVVGLRDSVGDPDIERPGFRGAVLASTSARGTASNRLPRRRASRAPR
jgi:hypothetical protein